ncbi:HAD family hydrolase [Brevundimonas goettingensis]|jgi:phosphoserine phosphatase|uniref:Haloacid dehalogenase-like hydrolase n=1 Tax=Brevundimonas goettingensis TaxID=2774190 RepID=A0A975C367_9CAUL|nr:haloacid dehalogenase-like hydrolase [Brevundimonas goettingensis]QTC92249.1 haloacid dehalogenase-like hydrolase [Brevundimonas goettingensis]
MPAVLPSWRDDAARSAILNFVALTTDPSSAHFVAQEDRIAVFGHDGTLWCEQPTTVQTLFARESLEKLAESAPSLRDREPFRTLLERDPTAAHRLGKRAIFEAMALIDAGLTLPEFEARVRAWLEVTPNPALVRLCANLVYQPQLELLQYLRASGFSTWIISAGGVDFIRALSQRLYGIPPEQVVGSSNRIEQRFDAFGGSVLCKLPTVRLFNDAEAKVETIADHIGRRPILAFGSSDSDLPMLRYAMGGPTPGLALLLHHDDAFREAAYDRENHLSPLIEGLDHARELGVTVVSMARDWKNVFA